MNNRIKDIMNGGRQLELSPLVILLSVISIIYGLIVRVRNILYSLRIIQVRQLPCPVISIGNITVGGTGKTPMTIYMAKHLYQMGYRVAVISRGYKGKAEKTGGVISDGNSLFMGVDFSGDEPLMMAAQLKHIPVLVGKRRFEMGMIAKTKFNVDIIILDDGFQHLKLKRDIDLVLLDSVRPLGNTHIFPRGVLREPATGLIRGDAYIMTRSDQTTNSSLKSKPSLTLNEILPDRPVFQSYHRPYYFQVFKDGIFPLEKIMGESLSEDFTFLHGRNVLAFSGIAGNHHFKGTIEAMPCILSDFMGFSDHYPYTTADLDDIVLKAKKLNVDYIMTTEKDYMRIYQHLPWPIDLVVVGVKIAFEDDTAFHTFIKSKLDSIQHRSICPPKSA